MKSNDITIAGDEYILSLISGTTRPVGYYYLAVVRSKAPTRMSTGFQLDEPTVGGYARATIENLSTQWRIDGSTMSNTMRIMFPTCQDDPWGRITYWALCDAPVGGRVFWIGSLAIPMYIDIDDTLIVEPGGMSLQGQGFTKTLVV